ncbi:MAG: hypothetical protein PHR63_04000 [Methanoregulaceae archaeon]|nr:hypothetical protein [Methanoregulaceae archaeon]
MIALNQQKALFFVLIGYMGIFLVSGQGYASSEKEYRFMGTSHKLVAGCSEIA